MGKPFIRLAKDNISSRFGSSSKDVPAFSIFDPKKVPSLCIEVTHLDICSFQERVGKPFIRLIQDNISSWFRSSSKYVSAFSIFDPNKCPASLLISYLYMETLQFRLSMDSLGEIYQLNHWKELNVKAAIVSSDRSTEWKTYRQLLKQPKDDISCN